LKNIILIAGSARNGKDSVGIFLNNKLAKCVTLHFADRIKNITRNYGWDGIIRNEYFRSKWQILGTERVRQELGWIDFWADTISDEIKIMENDFDYFMVPDFRYFNEYEIIEERFGDKVITIRVERPNFDNGLTEEQKNHSSENGLNEFIYDYHIENDGNLNDLELKVNKFIMEELELPLLQVVGE
jgi:hypothetical protein